MNSMHYIRPCFWLVQLMLMFSPVCMAEGYELGQGWPVGKYLLSGYANIEIVNRFDAATKLELDDLSLFASGRVSKWVNPFIEAELSKHTLIKEGGGAGSGDFIVERFYNDAMLSANDTLRIGKILTPLGEWNLVHAAPLIPTITRPYTTARGFDAYMSGISWMHEAGESGTSDIQLYWQPDNEWFKRPASQTLRNFHNVIGGHINVPFGLINKAGVSVQHGKLIETGEMFTLYGFNVNKSFGKLRLESEAITARFSGVVLPGASPRIHDRESGIFALAEYKITSKLHGILEWERYQDHTVSESSRATLVSLAYRPSVATVWKLEYIHQAGVSSPISSISTGLKAAYSLLF